MTPFVKHFKKYKLKDYFYTLNRVKNGLKNHFICMTTNMLNIMKQVKEYLCFNDSGKLNLEDQVKECRYVSSVCMKNYRETDA